MNVDLVMLDIFLAVFTLIVLGLTGKITWDWLNEGRTKTGEYYMSVKACEECRQNCCVGSLKTTLSDHIKKGSWHDSEVNTRLKNIEVSLDRMQVADEKLQGHFGKLEKAVTEIATTLKIYAKKSDERDRRTDKIMGGQ
jgi:hypothetical protein